MQPIVQNGIDNEEGLRILKGERLGLITNPSGVTQCLESTASVLKARYDLQAVYGPEHGIRGDHQAGADVSDESYDCVLGVRSYSLYGATAENAGSKLDGIDRMVYDIQDVGARFYTYIYTLADMMRACAKRGIPVTVLDRVNPLGGEILEGILFDDVTPSLVGRYPIPTRYGMTVGEFARYVNDTFGIGCDLSVVPCRCWKREMLFEETGLPWVMPSPNMPTLDATLCYIGTCLFEGTDVSEGRGTTRPFEYIGDPRLDAGRLCRELNALGLEGVLWREVHFTPCFSKHAGKLCHGVQLHIVDRHRARPFEAGLWLLDCIRRQIPEMRYRAEHFDRLLGTSGLREGRLSIEQLTERSREESSTFQSVLDTYRMY